MRLFDNDESEIMGEEGGMKPSGSKSRGAEQILLRCSTVPEIQRMIETLHNTDKTDGEKGMA